MKLLVFILLITGISYSCNRDVSDKVPVHQEEMQSLQITGTSLYNLNSDWITQDGNTVKLSQALGKVQLLAMVYTSCAYACPRIVADMLALDELIPTNYNDELVFTLVSFDPEHDTPAKLKSFASEHKLDLDRWTLLHGDPDDILELAAVLDVKYKKTTATDYAHSSIVSVINKNGEIVHQQIGLGVDPEEAKKAIIRELSLI